MVSLVKPSHMWARCEFETGSVFGFEAIPPHRYGVKFPPQKQIHLSPCVGGNTPVIQPSRGSVMPAGQTRFSLP